MDLVQRPRRLRASAAIRELVTENRVHPKDLILPVFVKEGATNPVPLAAMPGVWQHTFTSLEQELQRAVELGIGAIMVFAIPVEKDAIGSGATAPDGILNQSIRFVKERVGHKLVIVADLCLDEFTDHGHCGVLDALGQVDNDATLVRYQEMALALAAAGADLLGASGMMDGQVAAVRAALDDAGFTEVGILAYAAKYASAFYGPFREAVESSLQGDRKSYQQDPANAKESLREIALDINEGADIVMVKPGTMYLDIVATSSQYVEVPIASYIVSGEMAMVEFAAAAGAIDRQRAIMELATSVKRAGAKIICTYWALEIAAWLKEN